MIKLIVGLGNPGEQYQKTRHNAGFWLLEELARISGGAQWREEKKFFAQYCKILFANKPLHLLMPQTFMNASGKSVASLANFYNLSADEILVVHDELDLPEGAAKLKQGGGHGGHNGLRDIIAALDSREFLRLRLGIDHPGDRSQVVHYVLKAPGKEGREKIDAGMVRALRAIEICQKESLEKAMLFLHTENA